MNTVLEQPRRVQNVATALSLEQRATRQQEASRQLAVIIGHNPSIHLQPAIPEELQEDDVRSLSHDVRGQRDSLTV